MNLGLVGEGVQLHSGGLHRGTLLELHAAFAGVPHLAPVRLLELIRSGVLRQQQLHGLGFRIQMKIKSKEYCQAFPPATQTLQSC